MIEETGTVIQISEDKAQVLIPRNAACEGCHSCHSKSDGFGMITEVPKAHGLAIGDRVRLEGKGVSQAKGGLLIFILPLVLLFIGYLIGEAVTKYMGYASLSQTAGIITGFMFFVAPFLIIYLVNRKRKKAGEFPLYIAQILNKGGTNL